MNKPKTLYDKIVWLSENEGCEVGDGMGGLLACFNYCINDDTRDKVMDVIRTDVEYIFDETWEQYEYEMSQEDDFEKRAETVASFLVSDMIGKGLIADGDTHHQEEWKKRIKVTMENFG
jgi:hypothetical protein